jgi:CheY-like chemotaxis protein
MPQVAIRQEPAAQGEPCAVLVVEDDALIRLCVAECLRDLGYAVIEASNGDEALGVLASALPVAVVFSDVDMSGSTNGLQLALGLRRCHPETRVILTSAGLLDEPLRDALGGVPFISKPYQPEEVAKIIWAELEKCAPDEPSKLRPRLVSGQSGVA